MSDIRPEEIKQAFALFDPQNTGRIEPHAFQDFLNILTDEELKSTICIPTQSLTLKQFSEFMNKYYEDGYKDPEEPYCRAFISIPKMP